MTISYLFKENTHADKDCNANIGKAVAQLRERRMLRQTDVAAAFGSQQSFVSKLESGQRPLRLCELPTLADALDMPLDDLMTAMTAVLKSPHD